MNLQFPHTALLLSLGLFLPGAVFAGPVSAATNTIFGPNVHVFDAAMPAEAMRQTLTEFDDGAVR